MTVSHGTLDTSGIAITTRPQGPPKKVLWRAALVSLSVLAIGVVLGQLPL